MNRTERQIMKTLPMSRLGTFEQVTEFGEFVFRSTVENFESANELADEVNERIEPLGYRVAIV